MTCKALRGSSTRPQERTPDLPLSLQPHNMERPLRLGLWNGAQSVLLQHANQKAVLLRHGRHF